MSLLMHCWLCDSCRKMVIFISATAGSIDPAAAPGDCMAGAWEACWYFYCRASCVYLGLCRRFGLELYRLRWGQYHAKGCSSTWRGTRWPLWCWCSITSAWGFRHICWCLCHQPVRAAHTAVWHELSLWEKELLKRVKGDGGNENAAVESSCSIWAFSHRVGGVLCLIETWEVQ